ncbi:rop guanine nucleotide exchange factor-like protein [Rhynchospora pubera]|uniref:Rop guanine nucleotide exchange factor-like protein n=1 Tax=Rhynchospora pubera TaxID=906938 RepID=A0AAV8BT41_9POAL|nr:rop guanine nucleotide exchange factor-like protein [Rhynchospora pubera]
MRTLACCRRRTKDFSLDFEEHDKVMTYDGLESCILNHCAYEEESGISGTTTTGADGCVTTDFSLDEEVSSCSSSKDTYTTSSCSQCLLPGTSLLQEEAGSSPISNNSDDDLKCIQKLCLKGKAPVVTYTMSPSDIEAMKERFAKLLLGEDVTGGARGFTTALALSHAITNLSATVFGEMWKLEPLCEEKKLKWRMEMDWLLSPTNYMVELVPAKQSGANGRILEIMTPKARSDIHVNLPALQKLDSMLIEVLDSMIGTEFWYEECGSKAGQDGQRQSKRWWLPSPRVPETGLSEFERKKIIFQAKVVHQVLKAAKSINEQVLLQMPLPPSVADALPKSGKTSLGEGMYQVITAEMVSVEDIFLSFNFKNEHSVLDTVNRLESAVLAWKQKILEETNKRSPKRYQWYFGKDSPSEAEKCSLYVERVDALLHLIKARFPNLPHTFMDVIRVQYNTDVAHAIVEAYSRVIVGVAFSILSRIAELLMEDDLKKPTTPISKLKFDFSSAVYLAGITETPSGHIRRSLIDQMNMVDGRTDRKKRVKQLLW